MKLGFYPKMAVTGISKNRKVYIPYILTCIGMVMMFYIVSFLASSKNVATMPGGGFLQAILALGTGVIGFFSLIFLFYTNSFLIKKRKKEFGLYNILGMGKTNLARILFWESLFITVVSLIGGLFCGILFSKAAELLLARMLGGKVSFSFTIGYLPIIEAVVLFAVIFFLILLNSLRQIHVAKPVELLHSDSVGEKPPKSNWVLAVLGVIVLAVAYIIAISVNNPISALLMFFIAVIMVIAATYMLFVAGSVVFCKLLQKNKHYYYKTGHFVSVSSMIYRMKRNGAGLASICILSTMVLVMLSSTVCLFIGSEGSLRTRYPRNIVVDTVTADTTYTNAIDTIVRNELNKSSVPETNTLRYRYLYENGYFNKNSMIFEFTKNAKSANYPEARQLFIVPLADYNQLMGTNETLANDEVMIYCTRTNYNFESITMQDVGTVKVKKVLPKFVDNGTEAMNMDPAMYIIVPNFDTISAFVAQHTKGTSIHNYYGFDLSCRDSAQIAVAQNIKAAVKQLKSSSSTFPMYSIESSAENRAQFYALYGGLFFLGVLLGIVFILGAVLIMYYKQITEGYEDQSRFDIMQKVGMTKKEIKKSINSQVLTVFFLPLIIAGIHVAFAFPMISKMLAMFNLTDIGLFITVTIVCYLIFALFYTLVYIWTSRAYYSIVSSKD